MTKNSLQGNAHVFSLQTRYGTVFILIFFLLAISLLTRFTLLVYSWQNVELTFVNALGIFFLGLFFDVINASYFIIPWIIYLWVVPQKIFAKNWHRYVVYTWFFIFSFGILFNAVAEWFFWDEFNSRYNFIAVDYLVYTNEVLGNIQQSYPIAWIIFALIVINVALFYFARPCLSRTTAIPVRFRKRTVYTLCSLALPVSFFFVANASVHRFSTNSYVNELAGNGMYELFAAYRNNELDYNQFYITITDKEAFRLTRALITTPDSHYQSAQSFDVTRDIVHAEPEKKLNIVMISVESFSADFMRSFGNTNNITPFLDSLSEHSLFFTNLYATGTRTVRGLEALSLCIPPTPGQSIVRRPNNEELFSIGSVFEQKGYESKFIYGGYGYFDNMGYFFANNDYEVVDRSALKDSEIDYENIWGVADENLFTLAEREIEETVALHKPVFAHIMTTSNHRPYTYPDGRIDIPSHTGRDGAVKYTDYAIGEFIRSCSKRSWFDSTIFVIVADHCASSAGKTELPVNKYHIPLLIYSPANIKPAHMNRLMSQIDLGPTILGLLNFDYTSKFFGSDIFQVPIGNERAFISTYQSLGYIRNGKLIILSPQKRSLQFVPDFTDGSAVAAIKDEQLIREAIAWYQASSYSFSHNLYKK
jgi:phosphoglycerol transferase MdoB-like AlkP superfamily enzyme